MPEVTETPILPLNKDLDDIKAQVRKELDTVRDLMSTLSYHSNEPGWRSPIHLHRLRRALRIHYLALKIRESTPIPSSMRQLAWEFETKYDLS